MTVATDKLTEVIAMLTPTPRMTGVTSESSQRQWLLPRPSHAPAAQQLNIMDPNRNMAGMLGPDESKNGADPIHMIAATAMSNQKMARD